MRHDEGRIVRSWRSSSANGQRAEAQAGFRERAIAAHEIRICAGIDDVTERRSGQFLDGAEEVGGRVLRAGIHHDDSIRPDLNAHVTHWRRDQVEVRANLTKYLICTFSNHLTIPSWPASDGRTS